MICYMGAAINWQVLWVDNLDKLRMLIWDRKAQIFQASELEELLEDSAGNVYEAAAICLSIISADPERMKGYTRGGVRVDLADINGAIERYNKLAKRSTNYYGSAAVVRDHGRGTQVER